MAPGTGPAGVFEAATALVGAVAALAGYLAWLIVRVRRLARFLEVLVAEHDRLRRYAHRHDKTSGRVIPVRFGRGRHDGRRQLR